MNETIFILLGVIFILVVFIVENAAKKSRSENLDEEYEKAKTNLANIRAAVAKAENDAFNEEMQRMEEKRKSDQAHFDSIISHQKKANELKLSGKCEEAAAEYRLAVDEDVENFGREGIAKICCEMLVECYQELGRFDDEQEAIHLLGNYVDGEQYSKMLIDCIKRKQAASQSNDSSQA